MSLEVRQENLVGKSEASVGEEDLYKEMLRIRMVEERIVELYPEQEMRCPVHLSIGQEAVAVGVCAALERDDAVMSGHRAHAHYLAKGGSLKRMLAEIYGKETGCSKGRGGSMHLIDLSVNFLGSTPIVAGAIPVATGAAFADKLRGEKKVTVSFMGEGATEEGVWHESLNFASLHKLPIIYVCESNLYSVYTSLDERRRKVNLIDLVKAHGLKTFYGDGNNASEVYRFSREARDYVISGQGPVFIELTTYRWREHCGPNYDNDIGYRTEKEFLEWKEKDPIERIRKTLLGDLRLDNFRDESLRNEIEEEINEAVSFAKSSPYPKLVSVSDAYA